MAAPPSTTNAKAENYLAQSKKAMARKDLERILADDSSYQGVREKLAELRASAPSD